MCHKRWASSFLSMPLIMQDGYVWLIITAYIYLHPVCIPKEFGTTPGVKQCILTMSRTFHYIYFIIKIVNETTVSTITGTESQGRSSGPGRWQQGLLGHSPTWYKSHRDSAHRKSW